MKIDTIVIDEQEIKVRRGHREQEKKWFERVEEPKKTEYKRQKSNSKWYQDHLDDD